MFKDLAEDIQAQRQCTLPTGDWEAKLAKIKFDPQIGLRVHWYYTDDVKFAREFEPELIDEDIRDNAPFSGILVPVPDVRTNEVDHEHLVVVIDQYPTEKEWPSVEWIALARLLENEDLVEIFAMAK